MPLKLPDFFEDAHMKWVKRNVLLDIERADLEYFKECATRAVYNQGQYWFFICHGPYVLSMAKRMRTLVN